MTYAELERDANRLAHYLAVPGRRAGRPRRRSTPRTASSTSSRCWRSSRSARSTINVNYRYVEGELNYLFDNADVVALIFERTYAPLVATCAPKHDAADHVRRDRPTSPTPTTTPTSRRTAASRCEDALDGQSAERDFGERSADDIHIIYTGGTTGFPKGVMWRHEDFWRVLGGGIDFYTGEPLEEFDQSKQATDPRMVTFPLSPLMHGGAQAGLLMHLFAGHLTILEPKFDAAAHLGDHRAREGAADLHDRRRDGAPADRGVRAPRPPPARRTTRSSLFAISSSAAIFSPPVKKRWMDGLPERRLHRLGRRLRDRLPGHGHAGQGPHQHRRPGRRPRPQQRGHRRRQPASSTPPPTSARSAGSAAAARCRSATTRTRRSRRATFLVIDGERYSVPGDFARIEEDGKVTLLGRGSNCVNTGGEKVYPEEVEMAIKGHPAVYDVPRGRRPRREVRPVRRRRRRAARGRDRRARGPAHLPARAPVRLQAAARAHAGRPRSRATRPARRSTPRPRSWPWPRSPPRSPPHRQEPDPCAPPLRPVRDRVPDLRVHPVRARRRGGLARRRARRARLRAVQRRRGARAGPDLARRQHRRQAVRRRHRDADEDPHRGHVGRPRRDDPRGAQEVRRRDAAASSAYRRCRRARAARASSAGCTRWPARTSTSR